MSIEESNKLINFYTLIFDFRLVLNSSAVEILESDSLAAKHVETIHTKDLKFPHLISQLFWPLYIRISICSSNYDCNNFTGFLVNFRKRKDSQSFLRLKLTNSLCTEFVGAKNSSKHVPSAQPCPHFSLNQIHRNSLHL